MTYEQAWTELERFVDRGCKHYRANFVFGKDIRFYAYVAFRMKMNDLKEKIKEGGCVDR